MNLQIPTPENVAQSSYDGQKDGQTDVVDQADPDVVATRTQILVDN